MRIIETGGTIEGLEYAIEANGPHEVYSIIPLFLDSAKISFEYYMVASFLKTADSRFITSEDIVLAEQLGNSLI